MQIHGFTEYATNTSCSAAPPILTRMKPPPLKTSNNFGSHDDNEADEADDETQRFSEDSYRKTTWVILYSQLASLRLKPTHRPSPAKSCSNLPLSQ